MLGGIARVFSHRAAGPLWFGVACLLAAALVATSLGARRNEAFLRDRIAALADQDASQLKTELVSCRATVHSYAAAITASAARDRERARTAANANASPTQLAAELAANPPAGFDGCARMESADQAVLRALARK